MRTPLRKMFSAMLACAITIGIAPVTAHADDYTVDIEYNSTTTVHSVEMNGTTVILYCLQNKRHWPHHTDAFGDPPKYRQISFQEFCENNDLTDQTKINQFAEKLRRVLYAGYNYNGLGLYSSTGSNPITVDEFNSFLSLSDTDTLRSDFPDSIGKYSFTYEKRDDSDQRTRISNFVNDVLTMGRTGTSTKSGMDATQVEAMPFYKAAIALNWYA